MSNKIYQLQEKRSALLADAQVLVDAGLATAEQKSKYKSLIADADIIEGDIRDLQMIERELNTSGKPVTAAPAVITTRTESKAEQAETRKTKINKIWKSFIVNGRSVADLMPREYRDLTELSDGAGLAAVPQEFDDNWNETLKNYGPLASLVSVSNRPNGRPLKVTGYDDTASYMTYLSDTSSTSGVEQDPTFTVNAPDESSSLVSTILYSKQEAQDVGEDRIEEFISNLAFTRAARSISYAILTGTDNSPSNHVIPAMPTGGLLANVSSGVTGVALTGPTYAQLSALKAGVDQAFRVGPNQGFLVSQATHDFLVAQVTTTGAPLYTFNEDGLLMVAGSSVYIQPGIADYTTASSTIALYGNYAKAYRLVKDGDVKVQILTERYAELLINASVIYQRIQGVSLIDTAVKSMTTVS